MRQVFLWVVAGTLTIALMVLFMAPAAWLAPIVEKQTQGRLTLGDAQGTLWRGSAFIGGAPAGNEPVTPLLPGRFAWTISPAVLVGRVDVTLENPDALSKPVAVTGNFSEWELSPSAITLPAERLAGLGAPFNTILPSGQMRLSWNPLLLSRTGQTVHVRGTGVVELKDIASRLSPVKPLGAYVATIDMRGQEGSMLLKTEKGPMVLSGTGSLRNGRLRFSGTAEAEAGEEEKLSNFINLLGQRRTEGDKNVIALEFK
jgi:general secretion pathway protein N